MSADLSIVAQWLSFINEQKNRLRVDSPSHRQYPPGLIKPLIVTWFFLHMVLPVESCPPDLFPTCLQNLAEYAAPLKNEKLRKNPPRPHQAPRQAASAPKLSSHATFSILFYFRQTKYLPHCNKHAKKKITTAFLHFFRCGWNQWGGGWCTARC